MIADAEEFVQLRLSTTPADYMRAAEEEASIETWLRVIEDYPEMKRWVALNKTVQLEVLRVLAKDAEPSVRSAVADKRKLDRELFEELSRDYDEAVRARVAYNKRVPADLLELLRGDTSHLVRDAANR